MSTPNPLIPQGTFQAQVAKGATNVRLAVATIVAIHIVFFGGLLLQGCKRETATGDTAGGETNTNSLASLALPPMDSNSLYYPTPSSLPDEYGTNAASQLEPNAYTAVPPATADNLWQSTNLSSPLGTGAALGTTGASTSPMKEYTVVSGDSYSRIAVRNDTTISALKKANPGVNPLRIQPGQKINLPEPAPAPSAETGTGGNGSSGNIYTVVAGDNLTRIANKYNVTVSQLRAANGLRTARINVGQKLKIPVSKPTPVPAPNSTF